MKKLALLLTFIFIFSLTAFAKVGDFAGHIYETDIVAKIGAMPIPSYNIGGQTVIIAEEMADYGFKVVWNAENRSLDIYTGRLPENPPQKEITKSSTPGKIAGNIYETDITVQFNGMWVKSYNIGGKTAVCIEDMASDDPSKQFSRDGNVFGGIWNYAGANALWSDIEREIILNVLRPGDLPQKNMWAFGGDYIMPVSYTVTALSFENSDETVLENGVRAVLKDNRIFIPLSVYEKYKDSDFVIYNYATTRGSAWNNIMPLEKDDREAYWYKGEAYIDFTDKLKYKFELPEGCTEEIDRIVPSLNEVYINDMMISVYSTRTAAYISVRELEKFGFAIGVSGNEFDIFTNEINTPSEPPYGDSNPQSYYYRDVSSYNSTLFPVYNSPYVLRIDGKEVQSIFVHSVPTYNTPCVSIDDFAAAAGFRIVNDEPNVYKIYTE